MEFETGAYSYGVRAFQSNCNPFSASLVAKSADEVRLRALADPLICYKYIMLFSHNNEIQRGLRRPFVFVLYSCGSEYEFSFNLDNLVSFPGLLCKLDERSDF